MGTTDEASGDVYSDFEKWQENVIWPALAIEKQYASPTDAGPGFKIAYPRISKLYSSLGEAHVVSINKLTKSDPPIKKHMEIRLPAGMSYTSGDHLVVLPVNPKRSVQRALARFGLGWDAELDAESPGESVGNMPLDHSLPAATLFGHYVELASPASTNVRPPLASELTERILTLLFTRISSFSPMPQRMLQSKKSSYLSPTTRTSDTAPPSSTF
ncbi:FAD-binding type 1 [Macrophomina phaseolina MS6]|uniref:FAD-binding type 1 n=1 Tax=Macrophomina phaseolina (strain MS6) TaxID=1126212 RepID=K2S8C2_MACPH|nr:FAD-binding type 1 [Macrophomina phaseolina MS6]